jgi:KAP family P-loop domain
MLSVWEELSQSSKQALRWAGAMACLRADRAGRSVDRAAVDEYDLLVGIMLAHPDTSEPRQLLAHVGASAADVLPSNYPVPGEDLEAFAGRVPADGPPELTTTAANALEEAAKFRSDGAEVLELKALFGGLLARENEVAFAFSALLTAVGLSAAIDISSYLEWATGPRQFKDYAEFLAARHPFRASPVEVPEYKADKPGEGVTGDDLVDIRAEVDAFAYLLASKSLEPPLAVGLFGDWGSGKTYFMDAVKDRIAQLVDSKEARETPQKDLPFWKRIVQIDFNAWHYVKGDLWASLVEHVFAELRVTGDADQDALAKRQAHWLMRIEAKRSERAKVVEQLRVKRRLRTNAQHRLEAAEKRKSEGELELANLERTAPAHVALSEDAKQALVGLVDQVTHGTAGDALEAIDHARAQFQRGTVALGAYPWSRRKAAVVVASLFAVPLLVFALAQIDVIPVAAQVFAGVSAALALVTAALRSVTSWAKARLDALDEAEAKVRDEIEKQRGKLEDAVRSAAADVADAAGKIDALAARDEALEAEIADLEERKRSVTSGRILGEFVAERVGSSDYRKRLGIAALIQRDFDELSKLIIAQNMEILDTDTGATPPAPETVNRIILYIDDLDRCEPARVIEVLQAVHLLLAFPLFVVVVAVDSRWLANSLAEHYPALGGAMKAAPGSFLNGAEADQATPSDYLEKIFQVPFWIEPLGLTARKSLVRGLLQQNLAPPARVTHAPGGGGARIAFSNDAESMVQSMFDRTRAVRLQTAALSVTPAELAYLDGLAPLLGDTPRSIKRFVNVYQLLCALPLPPGLSPERYEQAVGFLLALADGLPSVYATLSAELERKSTNTTLSSVVEGARSKLPALEAARWDDWVKDHKAFAATAMQQLVEPARRVRRFTFHNDTASGSPVADVPAASQS